jgi:hypothetical protein
MVGPEDGSNKGQLFGWYYNSSSDSSFPVEFQTVISIMRRNRKNIRRSNCRHWESCELFIGSTRHWKGPCSELWLGGIKVPTRPYHKEEIKELTSLPLMFVDSNKKVSSNLLNFCYKKMYSDFHNQLGTTILRISEAMFTELICELPNKMCPFVAFN